MRERERKRKKKNFYEKCTHNVNVSLEFTILFRLLSFDVVDSNTTGFSLPLFRNDKLILFGKAYCRRLMLVCISFVHSRRVCHAEIYLLSFAFDRIEYQMKCLNWILTLSDVVVAIVVSTSNEIRRLYFYFI